MYLFDKKDNKVEVYSMEPNMEKIYDFRKKEMEQIPEDERVLKMVSNKYMDWSMFYSGVINTSRIDFREKGIFNKYYCNLIQYNMTNEERERQNKLLEDYYKSSYFYYKIRINKEYDKIKGLQTIKRLLMDNVCISEKRNRHAINDIISVPESILLLEILLSQDIHLLENEDISKQIELFNFSANPIEIVDYDMIDRYSKLNVVNSNASDKLDCKVEESQKILKYIKK